MGLQGVKNTSSKSDILKAIRDKKGVVTYIYKELGMSHTTFYEILNSDPEYKVALDEARKDLDDTLCDAAENALMFALSQRDDLGSSVRSAQYVLNNKGRKRGYTPPTVMQPADSLKPDIDRVLSGFDKLHSAPLQEQPSSHNESQASIVPPLVNPDISQ